MLIAVTTSDGVSVDLHFGGCREFYIYDENAVLTGKRKYGHSVDWHGGEGVREVLELLGGCSYLLTAKIGGRPHSLLKRAGITALEAPADIAGAIARVVEYDGRVNA
jgi:predicted Fe-Mo cluster-binding NifX family protein